MNNPTQHRGWILGMRGQARGGALALAVMLVLAILATGSAQAQTFTTLHNFDGTDGGSPEVGMIQATDGNFYGTTVSGGANGWGTIFKITPTGALTTLYSFCAQSGCADGTGPSGVVQATDGNFYGTTSGGGANNYGTVFKITPSGALTTLHSFDNTDGSGASGVVQGTDGNFYGTTLYGGANMTECSNGCGTVFRITSGGALTTLYSFCSQSGCTDGATPYAGVVQGTDGNFYGTTAEATPMGNNGYGTIFKVTPTGALTTLYTFCSQSDCTDGYWPIWGLVQGTDGNFYGTTPEGGAYSSSGTVFKITPGGTLTTLYNFCAQSGCTDGYGASALIQATDGNFYGVTKHGGAYDDNGTVFKITPTGALTTLHSFDFTDGNSPMGWLVQGTDGSFYGTTSWGGANSDGTVFSLSVAVTKATTTKTTLTSSPNPSTYGQAVTFIAAVTSKLGAPPDGETVSFMKGKAVLGTGTLSSGSASFTTSTLKAGNAIKAVYGGDSNFAGSASKWLKQVVEKATTTTGLTSSQNPSNFGQSVTFTATVAPLFSGTPTGTVTFNNGSTKLGDVSLSGGVASYTTTKLAVGTEPITAVYDGSSSFTPSTSDVLSQAVNQASTTTTLVSSQNPSSYKQAVTFTATVSPQFSGTVTGTMAFYDGATLLKTVTLSGDKVKFTTAKLASGAHSITATYNGSTDFTGSSSAPVTQTVN